MKLNLTLIGVIVLFIGMLIWGILSPQIRYLANNNIIVTQTEWDIRDSIANIPPDTIVKVRHDTVIIEVDKPYIPPVVEEPNDSTVIYVDTIGDNRFNLIITDKLQKNRILERFWIADIFQEVKTITIRESYPVRYDVIEEKEIPVTGLYGGATIMATPSSQNAAILGNLLLSTKKGNIFQVGAGINEQAKLAIGFGYFKKF